MPLATPLPYGLRDVKVTPYTDPGATVLGTPVDLPNARTFSFSEAEEFTELRGDDKVVTTRGQGASIEWDLEAGGLSFDVLEVIGGGTITESGSAPNQKRVYTKKVTDSRPVFKTEGQVISDSGGDLHAVLDRCRVTGNLEGEFGDGAFFLTSGSGVALPSLIPGREDVLYEFIQNESVTPIVPPAAATTATAGDPGTFNGTAPANLAGLAGVTASPATAWTEGQHVVLGDTSKAYWDGDSWEAGEAPA